MRASLTWETDLGDLDPVCAIHVSAVDDPDVRIKPIVHSFYPDRISWFDIADDLPRYAGFVADGKLSCHGHSDPNRTD